MTTQTVNTRDLDSHHLGKFVAVTSRHLSSPTVCIGRLVGVDHSLTGRVDMSQALTIALNADETTVFVTDYSEVLLADEASELVLEMAEKVNARQSEA